MTSGIEASILDALLHHFSTYPTTLDVSLPNIDFTPVDNYLEVRIFPNTVNQASLGTDGLNRHEGLMQITVV